MTVKHGGIGAALRYGLALVMGRMHKLYDVETEVVGSVEISGPKDEPVQIDGDVLTSLPLSVSLETAEVRLLVPKTHRSAI